jgi:hypothetical protein
VKTYQDLLEVGLDERNRIDFIRECITKFEQSPEYHFVKDAIQYYRGENPTIARAQKIVWDMLGRAHADEVSPNHKIYSRFFFSAVTELTQYLLGNGVSFDNNSVKEKLGVDFDTQIQELADDAQVAGVGWGFWNLDHLEVIPFLQFIPLRDETDSSVKAGIRFWRVDKDKPLHAILFELDGITEYIQPKDGDMTVFKPKRAYKLNVDEYAGETLTTEVTGGENYPSFPVIPLYFINHDSLLFGNRSAVDAYDLMLSKMVNNVDEGNLIYWVLNNCNGMDELDDAEFIANMIKSHVMHANGDAGAGADPHVIEAPIDGTETGIERIRKLLNDNFMTADTETLRAGNVTATQIKAAYQKLDAKTAKFEYNVIDFIQRLFVVAGIDRHEKFSFKYDRAFNSAEQVTTILQAAQFLDEETVTVMLLEAMGKIDLVEDVMKRKQDESLARYDMKPAEPQNEPSGAV